MERAMACDAMNRDTFIAGGSSEPGSESRSKREILSSYAVFVPSGLFL